MNKKSIIKIGFIVTITLTLLVWGINFLKDKKVFSDDNVFYVVYDKIEGLTVTCPVLINGFKVGKVEDIYFKENDKAARLVVVMSIDKKYKIPQGSRAEIYSIDLLGSKGIRLITNTDAEKFAASGDTLIGTIETDLKEQVNMQILPLKNKTEDLISSFDSVLTVVRAIFDEKTRQNLSRSFESIRMTINNLESTTFTLDTLMTSEKSKIVKIFDNIESITANLKNNNELIAQTIQNISSISDSIAKIDFVKTMNETQQAVAGLNEIVDKINNGDGSLALLLNNDTLYNNLDNAAYHLNRLLRDMHENPKRYVHFSLIDVGRTVYKIDKEDDNRDKTLKTKK